MKRLVKALMLGVGLLSISAMSQADEGAKVYKKDVHYTVIAETPTPAPEVREFFSFYCGHCAAFEQFVQMVKPSLKDGVFKRNHVNFLAGIPKSAQKNLTEAVALALTLDNKTQREAVIGAIFDRIHKDRDRVSVYQRVGVREVFKEQGVDHKWFDENVESSVVQMHVNKMESIQDKMTSMDAIKGVPTVVVNGKYRVETSKLNRKDPVNDYIALVDFLMTNP